MKEAPWFCINAIIWCCCGLGEASVSDRNSLTQCSCPSSEVPSPLRLPVGFSFCSYEPLKEPWSLKSFKAEVSVMRSRKGGGRKKPGWGSKATLCFGKWICQKEFLLEDSYRLAGGWRRSGGSLFFPWEEELRRDVNYSFWEKEKSAMVCWGPSLWQSHGPFSGSAGLQLQRGDFFSYLLDFMPCRPQTGPIPSAELPCLPLWLVSPIRLLLKERCLMVHCSWLAVVFSCFRKGRVESFRLVTWEPHRKVLDLGFSQRIVTEGVGTATNWKRGSQDPLGKKNTDKCWSLLLIYRVSCEVCELSEMAKHCCWMLM